MRLPRIRARISHALICLTLAGMAGCQPSEPAKTGWLKLNDYQLTKSIELEQVRREASGLTYDPGLDALWLVHDDPASLVLLDTLGGFKARWPLTGFNDPEAVALIEVTEQGHRRLVISDERTGRIVELSVDPTDPTLLAIGPIVAQLDKRGNRGVEGLDYRPRDHGLWLTSETFPQAVMHLSANITLTERWRSWPWRWPWDYSGLAYVPATDSLLVLSERSSVLMEYDLQGNDLGRLKLPGIKKAEGVAVAPDGRLFICAEPNRLYIFEAQTTPE